MYRDHRDCVLQSFALANAKNSEIQIMNRAKHCYRTHLSIAEDVTRELPW